MATATDAKVQEYLGNNGQLRELAIWIASSPHPFAETARRAVGLNQTSRPLEVSLKTIIRYLFDVNTDIGKLIAAFERNR